MKIFMTTILTRGTITTAGGPITTAGGGTARNNCMKNVL